MVLKTNKKYSRNLHSSKQRTTYSRPSRTHRIILAVISLVFIAVAIAIFCALFFTPERITKSTISALAADYYENNFYDQLSLDQASPSEITKYETYGFAPVTLRQLLLYDDQKNAATATSILKYCDENATVIRFFLDSPYGKTDYHVDYTYSCNL